MGQPSGEFRVIGRADQQGGGRSSWINREGVGYRDPLFYKSAEKEIQADIRACLRPAPNW
jgi:hypothetical protein